MGGAGPVDVPGRVFGKNLAVFADAAGCGDTRASAAWIGAVWERLAFQGR